MAPLMFTLSLEAKNVMLAARCAAWAMPGMLERTPPKRTAPDSDMSAGSLMPVATPPGATALNRMPEWHT